MTMTTLRPSRFHSQKRPWPRALTAPVHHQMAAVRPVQDDRLPGGQELKASRVPDGAGRDLLVEREVVVLDGAGRLEVRRSQAPSGPLAVPAGLFVADQQREQLGRDRARRRGPGRAAPRACRPSRSAATPAAPPAPPAPARPLAGRRPGHSSSHRRADVAISRPDISRAGISPVRGSVPGAFPVLIMTFVALR